MGQPTQPTTTWSPGGSTYQSNQDAVNAVRPGWVITGTAPNIVEVDNPAYTPATAAVQPQKIKQQQGYVLTIQDPNNSRAEPDEIIVSSPVAGPGGQQGGISITRGPTKPSAPANTSQPSTPAANLERLDQNLQPLPAGSTQQPTYVRDPKAPAGTAPFRVETSTELGDPTTWTPVYDPNDTSQTNRRVIGYFDPKSQKVAASVPGQAGNKPSDPNTWTPVYRTPGDAKSGVVGQWDAVNNDLHPVSMVDGKQIVTTPSAIYVIDKDTGATTKVQDIDKSQPYQLASVDGKPYRFDPNEKDISKALVPLEAGATLPKSVTQNGVTWTLNDATQKYELPPGVPRPTTMTGAGTASKYLITYDATTGEEISKKDNPNYQAPNVQLPTANAVSPFIPAPDPNDPTKWTWVENKGRVEASDALKAMASQLSGQVVSGAMSVDEAKAIIDGANSSMQSAAQAASSTLGSITNAAATGAGLLNQRAATAQNLVNQGLGILGQTKHGLIGDVPADFGQNLVQGAMGFANDLYGGQDVANAAANLVRRADPTGAMGQDAARAYAVMTQLFQGYRQATGGVPHPLETALSGSQGMTGPQTQLQQPPPQFAQSGLPEGRSVPTGFVSPPSQPATPAPFVQSGLPEGRGVAPIQASPFVAPPPNAVPAPQSKQITINVPV